MTDIFPNYHWNGKCFGLYRKRRIICMILNTAYAFSEQYFIFPPMEQNIKRTIITTVFSWYAYHYLCLFVPWFFLPVWFCFSFQFCANSWLLTVIHCLFYIVLFIFILLMNLWKISVLILDELYLSLPVEVHQKGT